MAAATTGDAAAEGVMVHAAPESSAESALSSSQPPVSVLDTGEDLFSPSQSPPSAGALQAEGPITYTDVVRAVKDAMAPIIELQTEKLQRAVQELKTQLHQVSQQVSTNECRIGETFQDLHTLKEEYTILQKSHLQLSNKVDDLENRSRRCNLRVIGIPESVK